jgi:HTH-type transcriptional regulator / antitoxin HigA
LQRDLIPELGNEATVSLVLSGKRSLTIDHIVKLCQRFRVSAAAFFPSPEAKQLVR